MRAQFLNDSIFKIDCLPAKPDYKSDKFSKFSRGQLWALEVSRLDNQTEIGFLPYELRLGLHYKLLKYDLDVNKNTTRIYLAARRQPMT